MKKTLFCALLTLVIVACRPATSNEDSSQSSNRTTPNTALSANPADSVLQKYRDQPRPAAYDGIMMYDLLTLVSTPANNMLVQLTQTDQHWERVIGAEGQLFHNKKYNQYLSKASDVELFFLDYSPYHKQNIDYLKEHGYFSYDDPTLGNSYFTCDSIFVTWRPNEDAKGGSSMLLFDLR